MSDPNPYRSPPELGESTDESVRDNGEGSLAIEFESDWSQQGLRERRRSDWHRFADIGLVSVATLAVGSLMLGGAAMGMFCLLMPVSVLLGVLWLSGWQVRSGSSFARRYPALAGPVKGTIEGTLLRVRGPALELVTRGGESVYPMISARGGLLRMPGIDESVPVLEQDVHRTWRVAKETPQNAGRLIDHLSIQEQPHVFVTGEVSGVDFRGLRCRGQWIAVASLSLVLGAGGFLWAGFRFSQLPEWVVNPPGHYQLTSGEEASLAKLWVLGAGAALLVAVGSWYLFKAFRNFGSFAAAISPEMIGIVTSRAVYGYQHDSLSHFRWEEQGIVVRDARGQTLFVVPARWFDKTQAEQVAKWYAREPSPRQRTYYITPKV